MTYVLWLDRHRKAVLWISLILLGLFTWCASALQLKPGFAELLPQEARSVKDLRRIAQRMIPTDLLIVAVEGPNRHENAHLIDAIAGEVGRLPPRLLGHFKYRVDEERDFFDHYKWLYLDRADSERLRDRLENEIARHKNPLFVSLDEDEEPVDPKEVEKKYSQKFPEFAGLSGGYIATATGDLFVLLIWPPEATAVEGVGKKLSTAVRAIMSRQTHSSDTRITLAGNIQTSLEEEAALLDDILLVSAVCTSLVLLVILLYFRSARAILYVGFPSLLGVAAAFAFAELAFGTLNMSTAFLGPIILGNGINFPIIFISRYAEEAGKRSTHSEAVFVALSQTWLPTLIAASAASVAYGSLSLTSFRGFSQFGAIGGVGMLLCWVASMTTLPALVLAWEARAARPMREPARAGFSGPAAWLVERSPHLVTFLGVAISVAALAQLPPYLEDPIEYNFRKMRNQKTQTSDLSRATKRVDKLFRRSLNPAAILADRQDQVPLIRQALLKQDREAKGGSVLDSVETLELLLPGTQAEQQNKLQVLAEIRRLVDDPALQLLDEEDRAQILKLRPPEDLRPIDANDLPRALRRRFSEKDGTLGRILYLYPNDAFSSWRGRDAIRFADITRKVTLPTGETIYSASNSVVFADALELVLHDGPRATLWSLGGVILLVVLLTRSTRSALLIVGSLCLGVLWMMGAVAGIPEKINFLNFIALPITFGIGVDYGVNVYARYRVEGTGGMARAVRNTGGAVVLCSATTIIGYASLLAADNRGLVSFGLLAIFGEIACLATAVLLMPAVVEWIERRGRQRS